MNDRALHTLRRERIVQVGITSRDHTGICRRSHWPFSERHDICPPFHPRRRPPGHRLTFRPPFAITKFHPHHHHHHPPAKTARERKSPLSESSTFRILLLSSTPRLDTLDDPSFLRCIARIVRLATSRDLASRSLHACNSVAAETGHFRNGRKACLATSALRYPLDSPDW